MHSVYKLTIPHDIDRRLLEEKKKGLFCSGRSREAVSKSKLVLKRAYLLSLKAKGQ